MERHRAVDIALTRDDANFNGRRISFRLEGISSSISLSPKGERREFHLCEASYNRAFYKLPLRVRRGYRDSWDRDLIDFYKILAVARMERKVRGISFFSLDYRRRRGRCFPFFSFFRLN